MIGYKFYKLTKDGRFDTIYCGENEEPFELGVHYTESVLDVDGVTPVGFFALHSVEECISYWFEINDGYTNEEYVKGLKEKFRLLSRKVGTVIVKVEGEPIYPEEAKEPGEFVLYDQTILEIVYRF